MPREGTFAGLQNLNEEAINPATEDKQDAIIAAVEGIAIDSPLLTAVNQGRKVVAVTNTAETLVGSTTPSKKVIVTALSTNQNPVVIGGSGVVYTEATRSGTPLLPFNSLTIEIDNVQKLYVNGAADDGVSFTFFT